jgi:hypothetical protein
MPEGVLPQVHIDIFNDFDKKGWLIIIFDNILVLADTYEDAYSKFQRVMDRCHKQKVVLKMAKSWMGFEEAKFFGFEISQGKYR